MGFLNIYPLFSYFRHLHSTFHICYQTKNLVRLSLSVCFECLCVRMNVCVCVCNYSVDWNPLSKHHKLHNHHFSTIHMDAHFIAISLTLARSHSISSFFKTISSIQISLIQSLYTENREFIHNAYTNIYKFRLLFAHWFPMSVCCVYVRLNQSVHSWISSSSSLLFFLSLLYTNYAR